MKVCKMASCASISLTVLAIGLFASTARANTEGQGTKVKWARVVGIIEPGGIVGRRSSTGNCNVGVRCVAGTPAPWIASNGNAELNVDSGRAQFTVNGLVLAGDPFFDNIGTRAGITLVKGTFVCNDTGPGPVELVDTEAVPLSTRGAASFQGHVDLPASCMIEPEDIVFLVRIAEATPDLLVDLWNAFGAVRSILSANP